MAALIHQAEALRPEAATLTPEEWEDKRSIIARLYHDEGKPLNEVYKIMYDQYQFYAK